MKLIRKLNYYVHKHGSVDQIPALLVCFPLNFTCEVATLVIVITVG